MVVGIVALVTFWVPFVDLVLGFLAIGLSWGGMIQADRPGYTGKGMGIAGLICGIIAVIPALIVMLFFFGLFAAAGPRAGSPADRSGARNPHDVRRYSPHRGL